VTSKPWVLLPLLLLGAGGCEEAESERCVTLYKSAQVVVRDAHSGSEASVSQGREAVLGAMAACRGAGKASELDQLAPALARLDAQLVYLRARPSSVPKKELSPGERAELLRTGDPKCPKGQGYKDKATGKEVRCRGPQLVYLSWAKAKEYFELRGYKLKSDKPNELSAEFGSELFVFEYRQANDAGPPKCVTLYPSPGVPMLEAAARATGVKPNQIKPPAPLNTDQGPLGISVEESDTKLVIRLGECR